MPVQPTSNVPVDPQLGKVQPQILPSDGYSPIRVDDWYYNYGGLNAIIDGNQLGVQSQGRWIFMQLLIVNATNNAQDPRVMPANLIVLKDDQGRIYRPNLDASEAYFNQNPDAFSIHPKQPVSWNQNLHVPFLFDIAPDATNLILFSPIDTNNGFLVRANAN